MSKEKRKGNREQKKPKATAKTVSPNALSTEQRILSAKPPGGKSGK